MGATGSFVWRDGEKYYEIADSGALAPFLINVASPSDVWVFLSSRGGMTAGRVNEQGSLFPYETDDKLNDQLRTGGKTLIRVPGGIWEPFERGVLPKWDVTRNLYKSVHGTSVIFEEINHALQLCFSCRYTTSERFGLVRESTLCGTGRETVEAQVLDGLENLLPYHVNPTLQATSSTLVDAYKAGELAPEGNLAVYSMTTQINDTPTPVEAMKANVAWTDRRDASVALTSRAVEAFARGSLEGFGENQYGCKGAYLVTYRQTLRPGEVCRYRIVADAGYDHCALAALRACLREDAGSALDEDIRRGEEKLRQMVAAADGVQDTGDEIASNHHYLNTLYNLMRGGAFADGYGVDPEDFLAFVGAKNHALAQEEAVREKIASCRTIQELKARFSGDERMARLTLEYLPISFSRRHGDPSRPWNKFNIRLRDDRGRPIRQYEGNWRDIFQNWEALGASYPEYYEHMIARFVGASTPDGFNPYRIYREGVDWERPEPDNPFSGLGYWGDHQMIYLLRLLKGMDAFYPDRLTGLLDKACFAYADVPYRLKSFDEILRDSKHTVMFDESCDREIAKRCDRIGTDGQLVQAGGEVYRANLMEKLTVPLLCKMANFLPLGGVWMNTQRPEWNDANNAIVGIGLSMVTVYHMRAYAAFLRELIARGPAAYDFSAQVLSWLRGAAEIGARVPGTPEEAWHFLCDMGTAFERYRGEVYAHGFSGKARVSRETLAGWADDCLRLLDATLAARRDKLFDSYNLLSGKGEAVRMRPMLEGQSAAIGALLVKPEELPPLLREMDGALRRDGQGAHCLYPVRLTVPFLEKNEADASLAADGRILLEDAAGKKHFAPDMTTEEALARALDESGMPERDKQALREEYERLFRHGRFTGRSEVMYKFEGIGCVYWHQNAKLALAILETALSSEGDPAGREQALACYRRIVEQFPYRRSPRECGAFPLEPYSHSAFDGFVRQPGMTGQVKESLLMRRAELGVVIAGGRVRFAPWLVRPEEFDANGEVRFTLCGVPVTYRRGSESTIELITEEGEKQLVSGLSLSGEQSRAVFGRQGVRSLTVTLSEPVNR